MGDVRYRHAYARVERADDRARVIRNMSSEDLVSALATTTLKRDPLLVNVIATELHNRVRRTHAALESIAEGIVTVDRDAIVNFANATALRLLSMATHEVVGRHAEDIGPLRADGSRIPWEERPTRRALELGETAHLKDAHLGRPDGTRFPISILAAPIVAEGDVLGAIVVFRDMSEERRAAAALAFHKRLLDAVGEAVVATTLDGRITYWNARAEALYGWRVDEVMGRNIVDVTPIESSRADAEAIMQALREGRTWSGVFPVRGRSGRTFNAHVTNAPVLDDAGSLVGIIGISRPT